VGTEAIRVGVVAGGDEVLEITHRGGRATMTFG
jgi:hypothetical protein